MESLRKTQLMLERTRTQLLVDWDPPLSIGPQAFSYLLQTFQDLHQSVDATVNGVQVRLAFLSLFPLNKAG